MTPIARRCATVSFPESTETAQILSHSPISKCSRISGLSLAYLFRETQESISLTPVDFETFLNALENPPIMSGLVIMDITGF